MKIVAIESSCDESAAAVFDSAKGFVFETLYSQVDLHALYGGVVPDLASMQHLEKLPHLIKKMCGDFDAGQADAIAVTNGPGLPNCLAIGVAAAAALAFKFGKPLFGVNHLRGHAYSPFIPLFEENPANFEETLKAHLPHLGLVVSGGNSILFGLDENLRMSVLAETADDAAGEALDKGAKMLGMPYPGAPILEKTAEGGDAKRFDFPRGQNRKIEDDPDFSFSGLKTSLRYFLNKLSADEIARDLPDIAASYQRAVVEQLRLRTAHFLKRGNYKSLGISGGVSNNLTLREAFRKTADDSNVKMLFAKKAHCGDNAAIIAFGAFIDFKNLKPADGLSLQTEPSKSILQL